MGTDTPEPPDDFGIGVIGSATGNVIEQNLVTGNTNGIYIAATVGQNVIPQQHGHRQSRDPGRQHAARVRARWTS
jgi:parallel beta-helix repeat protein